jgi:cytochrome c554/c'-like protein
MPQTPALRSVRPIIVVLAWLSGSATAQSEAPTLPQYGGDSHLGVVTCAGSTCHGATRPFQNAAINQNEFVIWQRKDKHARAYKVLLNDQSKRIARNLGLKAAHEAKICLDCHSDNAGENLRGKRFQLADGVGCEACHGGSKRYLGPHVSGENTRQQNLDVGMYATETPESRALLCLSCHLGTDDKFATHRIMGAGHPRISFELDTFTELQPAHYKIDEDYRKRKQVFSGVQVWAIGQLIAVERFLKLLASPKYRGIGPWPELAFYDCHACHHPMSDRRWRPRELTRALGPGVVRLNDANFLILSQIAGRIAPDLGERFKRAVEDLHQATVKDQTSGQAAAARLGEVTGNLRGILVQFSFSAADMKAMLQVMASKGASGEYNDYGAAEQAVMAMASIKDVLEETGSLTAGEKADLTAVVSRLYAVLEDPDKYRPEQLSTVLQTLADRAPRS